MRIGRGGGNWYDIIIGLAALIVYPDKALSWIGDRTGREFNLRHLAYFEVVVISLMIAVTSFLMPIYPRLLWWHPLLFFGMLGAIRLFVSLLTRMCGFKD